MTQRLLARRGVAPWLAFTFLVLSAPGLSSASAVRPAVSVGDVVVAVEGMNNEGKPELKNALRRALTDELLGLRNRGMAPRHPLVVSATLTTLSSECRADRARATAAISLALLRAEDRVLLAELSGRASAEETNDNLASVRSAALRGAVRGAIGRLPEAVERSR